MNAGDLRQRVKVQEPRDEEQDSHGEPLAPWATLAEVWAAVEPYWGRELFVAARDYADLTHRVTIRYLKQIDQSLYPERHGAKLRLLLLPEEKRTLQVEAVIDKEERRREMLLLCRETR